MSDSFMLPVFSDMISLNLNASAAYVAEEDESVAHETDSSADDDNSGTPVSDNGGAMDDDDELPNLAKLVAATVRDRVVLEQMEDIRALQAQLGALQRVEITGHNGTPVYARGCFSKGDFNALSLESLETDEATGLFWDVGLEMVGEKTMPLRKLSGIELRVGGCLYVTTAEVEGTVCAFGIRPGNQFDLRTRDMSRSAVVEFNTEDDGTSGGRAALLTFHVCDFPRGHWRSLQSVAMLNRSIALRQQEREEQREERRELRRANRSVRLQGGEQDTDEEESDSESDVDNEDPLDVFNYLTLCLSKRHPGQRAEITSVSLCVKSVRGRLENLNRGEDFERAKQRVFAKIDEMHQEELEEIESYEEEFATLNDV